jgi:hypothetical protein
MAAADNLMAFLPFAVIAVVFLMVGVGVWANEAARKRRTQQLSQLAGELSLDFQEALNSEQEALLSLFPLFQQGRSPLSSNAIVADNDLVRMLVLDYKYTVGSGKNSSTHKQTVALVSSNQLLHLPEFSLSPESWLDRIGDLLTNQDIDFEGDPEFSKTFVLKGPEQIAIQDFLDSRRRRELLKIKSPTIMTTLGAFILYRHGQLVAPEKLKEFMSEAFSIYQIFTSGQEVST